jgi:succinyl-diaminopimelate desuccinylase
VDTYNEFTGRNGEAYCIGGGTYARHFKCSGAFGPNDPLDPMPDWIGAEHSADEGFSEEQFKRALEIYIVSLDRLMRLSF